VLGPWEFLWRAESCIFSLCVSPLCAVPGRYDLFKFSVGADGGTVQIIFLSSSAVAGTVRLKWWGGWSVFFCFL
jgi:hypothetical protein